MMKNDYVVDEYIKALRKLETMDSFKELMFLMGNCFLRKGDFNSAKKYYQISIKASFSVNSFWKRSGQPNLLIDALILSKRIKMLNEVASELTSYQTCFGNGSAPILYYSLCIVEFLLQNGTPDPWIRKLLDLKKIKISVTKGQLFSAICEGDTQKFNDLLKYYLTIHDRQVKYGALRNTPEGLICMSAMSMIYIALRKGIPINVKSIYIFPEFFLK
jgi:hypothetical protein